MVVGPRTAGGRPVQRQRPGSGKAWKPGNRQTAADQGHWMLEVVAQPIAVPSVEPIADHRQAFLSELHPKLVLATAARP